MTSYKLLNCEHACLALSHAFYGSPKIFHFLLKHFDSLTQIHNNRDQIAAHFSQKNSKKLADLALFSPQKQSHFLSQNNIKLLTLNHADYPLYLKEIYNPPPILYYKGNLSLTKQPMLGIVGPRKLSPYGKTVTEYFTKALCHHFCIVSGLASGCDTLAHQTCIQMKQHTIAVLGVGLDKVYPYENKTLQETIAKEHLLLTEIPLFNRPAPFHFPLRNRLISGLSKGVLITEAKQKSGSLITANYALEQNREVFAVPGSIFSDSSAGVHALIKQGATCTISADDIFDAFQIKNQTLFTMNKPVSNTAPLHLSKNEEYLFHTLKTPKTIDDLAAEGTLAIHDILHSLTVLEIQAHIKKNNDNTYSRC